MDEGKFNLSIFISGNRFSYKYFEEYEIKKQVEVLMINTIEISIFTT